jgi:hypothetical protein
MRAIQEIRIRLSNGDLFQCHIEAIGAQFGSSWQLIQADGTRFDPSRTPPVITASLAFEALLTAISGVAGVRKTRVFRIDNPCNAELVSGAQQQAEVAKQGLSARVLVNGK